MLRIWLLTIAKINLIGVDKEYAFVVAALQKQYAPIIAPNHRNRGYDMKFVGFLVSHTPINKDAHHPVYIGYHSTNKLSKINFFFQLLSRL